jgi:hypothetical protein
MGHYAKVENNIVTQVIVAQKDFIDTLPDKDQWVKTSYNTYGGVHYDPITRLPDGGIPIRKNFASPGHIYDKKLDVFYSPQPAKSWTLNPDTYLWEPPIPYPSDNAFNIYYWDEDAKNWIILEGEKT